MVGIYGNHRIREWTHKFESLGESFFNNLSTNKSYSKDLKEIVIKEYLLFYLKRFSFIFEHIVLIKK